MASYINTSASSFQIDWMRRNKTELSFSYFKRRLKKALKWPSGTCRQRLGSRQDSMCVCMHTRGEGGPLMSVHLSQTKSSPTHHFMSSVCNPTPGTSPGNTTGLTAVALSKGFQPQRFEVSYFATDNLFFPIFFLNFVSKSLKQTEPGQRQE